MLKAYAAYAVITLDIITQVHESPTYHHGGTGVIFGVITGLLHVIALRALITLIALRALVCIPGGLHPKDSEPEHRVEELIHRKRG